MVSPYLNRYRNAAYLQYMKDVVKLVNKEDVNTLLLKQPRDRLFALIEEMDNAYSQAKGSALTKKMKVYNEYRDKAFIGIKRVVSGYSYHYDREISSSGQEILRIMQIYGSQVIRKSYQEKSVIINSFLDELINNSKLSEAVAVLKLEGWIENLRKVNNNFIQKYLKRVEESAANNNSVSVTDLRAGVSKVYRKLLNHLEAHNTLSANKAYKKIITEINELTSQYNSVVNARASKVSDAEYVKGSEISNLEIPLTEEE